MFILILRMSSKDFQCIHYFKLPFMFWIYTQTKNSKPNHTLVNSPRMLPLTAHKKEFYFRIPFFLDGQI